jgi:acyl-CoA synthetase (AMP-forming)/AMP-acid ligase II
VSEVVNVSLRLAEHARQRPDQPAIVLPQKLVAGKRDYRVVTFGELEQDVAHLAAGLRDFGIQPGTRIAMLVPMGYDFIALVFALLRAGIVAILVDPGMGRRNVLSCLAEAEPEGFIAIPLAHAVRLIMQRKFPKTKHLVTVGKRYCWGGTTLDEIRSRVAAAEKIEPITTADDPAAIIFTTGSTGPPKGTLYQHRIFDRQVAEIQQQYNIQPGEIDLPGFPLFGLFNAAMGVTTVIPLMDPTRPAKADPRLILEALTDWKCTQAFGSPALWNVVGLHCAENQIQLPHLKRVLSAGAPVPPHVLKRMQQAMAPDGEIHTPYGATEALPVATISAREVLGETADRTAIGAGTCVGQKFPGLEWRIIQITDEPIEDISQTYSLPPCQVGELIVRGDVVTREYVTRKEANALHKIRDGESFWHRMGDVGYFEGERFWYCGRKSHRVVTATQTLFTDPCEAIFNQHPAVYRSALVGVGERGRQVPVIIVEPWPDKFPGTPAAEKELLAELRALGAKHPHTADIEHFFVHRSLPVDIRHNAKIFREKLAVWAAPRIQRHDR